MNCHPDLPIEEKAHHLNNFSLSMMNSGHDERFRRTVISRALARYRDSREQLRVTGRPMYRSRVERQRLKAASGGKEDKTSWFGKLGYNNTLRLPAPLDG